MKHPHLVAATFLRHRGRTIFTWLAVVVAFVLFSILAAVWYGMLGQLTASMAERLDTYNLAAYGDPMPLSYYDKIASVPGVVATMCMAATLATARTRKTCPAPGIDPARMRAGVYVGPNSPAG